MIKVRITKIFNPYSHNDRYTREYRDWYMAQGETEPSFKGQHPQQRIFFTKDILEPGDKIPEPALEVIREQKNFSYQDRFTYSKKAWQEKLWNSFTALCK